MNILIIEDEVLAAERLTELLRKYNEQFTIVHPLDSVKDSVEWLRTHPAPDLILMDIQLSDGTSFNIFNQVEVKSPVIFTTAYDQYAIQAFKVNSIDYLLKPIAYPQLTQALNKWQTLGWHTNRLPAEWLSLTESLRKLEKPYKTRFLVKFGDRLQFKNVSEVAYFYAEGKNDFLTTLDGKRYVVEYTLEELEGLLDPNQFFRLNRSMIVQISAIREIKNYQGGRLRIMLQPNAPGEVLVSRERVANFKTWLDK